MSALTLQMKLKDVNYRRALDVLGRIPKSGPGRKKAVRKFKLVDIRSKADYNEEHIEEAISCPFSPSETFVERFEELVSRAKSSRYIIVLIGDPDKKNDNKTKAAQFLMRGFNVCGLASGERYSHSQHVRDWTQKWSDLTTFKMIDAIEKRVQRILREEGAKKDAKKKDGEKDRESDQSDEVDPFADVEEEKKNRKRPLKQEEEEKEEDEEFFLPESDDFLPLKKRNNVAEKLEKMEKVEKKRTKKTAEDKRQPTLWQHFVSQMMPTVMELNKEESPQTTCARIWNRLSKEQKAEFERLVLLEGGRCY